MSLDGLEGCSGRRDFAKRIALESLETAGDPVANALRTAVAAATQVEITDRLMATFAHMYGGWEIPDGMSQSEFALRCALQAAGFEIIE